MKLFTYFLAVPLSAASFCINAGGPTVFASDGISAQCFGDEMFSGGTVYTDPSPPPGIDSTTRYGNFSYTIPANVTSATSPPGFYRVTLKFVDPNVNTPGGRIFYVTINGQNTPNIDLAAETNGVKRLVAKSYIVLSYGQIKLQFTTVVRNAIVNEIDVDPITPLDIFNAQTQSNVQALLLQAYRDAIVNHPCVTDRVSLESTPCPPGFNGFLIAEWRMLTGAPGPVCLRMDLSTGNPIIIEDQTADCLADANTWWFRKDGAGNVL